MELSKAISFIEAAIGDPSKGLPEDVFLLISRISPMVNVDLLIKNQNNQTLLTWRDDIYYKAGWHVPGGIIRFKETAADRIRAVANTELGCEVKFCEVPLAIHECIDGDRRDRGHFISLLFSCSLLTAPAPILEYKSGQPRLNQWKWHDNCPQNILSVQEIYRKYF